MTSENDKNRWGYFADPLTGGDRTWVPVVTAYWDRNGRDMVLEGDVLFVDCDGRRWYAGTGSHINGLSAPRLLWRIAPPFVGLAREASVVHDAHCELRRYPSWEVHRMFYRAMRSNGVGPLSAFSRWLAVRLFGPKFKGRAK